MAREPAATGAVSPSARPAGGSRFRFQRRRDEALKRVEDAGPTLLDVVAVALLLEPGLVERQQRLAVLRLERDGDARYGPFAPRPGRNMVESNARRRGRSTPANTFVSRYGSSPAFPKAIVQVPPTRRSSRTRRSARFALVAVELRLRLRVDEGVEDGD